MSDTDRLKWDERYRAGAYADREHPSALLAERAARLAPGRALDVACGAGRNALFLAEAGWRVDALDISAVGLARARQAAQARGLELRWIEADLDGDPDAVLPQGPYELIALVRYVNPALTRPLIGRLARGGMLVIEQHLDCADEDVVGPRNPAFRLRPNALLRAVLEASGPEVLVREYREGIVTDPDGRRAALAQLVAVRGMAVG